MGLAIARAAKAQGAQVTLVAANLDDLPGGLDEVVRIQTAAEMADAVRNQLGKCDVLVMAAAVADFRVENPAEQKLKKAEIGESLELRLVQNADILKSSVNQLRDRGLRCVTVGFAAETAGNQARLAGLAATKLESKGCDLIIANDVSGGAVFGSQDTAIFMLDRSGNSSHFEGSKVEAGTAVAAFIAQHLSAL
jgi:phosphopantothenoylcysteine decarboxylase/phosphopantothenate--cysteine ligase